MPNDNVLKPCPFCGGDVKHIQGLPPLDDSHFIDCPGCGISSKIASTKEAVIEAWNRRAHPGQPEPRASKCDGSGAVSVSVDDWSECPVCRGAGCQPESHKWDEDGERCERCGDKDWMPDSVCRGRQPEPRAEVMPLKVERHSDMSVLVVFNSCRQASVFEREIAVRIQGVES
ncbi:restriction alleviation protein, Lar family [Burkholderia pseudomallei]|nr:restriction alleviation protein, Lar family [Burkholderia pseudomallei]